MPNASAILQKEKHKMLTSDQVITLVLALEGYDPWLKLLPKQEHTISVDITSIRHTVSSGQWGVEVDLTITDKAKYSKDSVNEYSLYIGYYETLTQINPGLISLFTQQNGELITCLLGNIGYATDLLRQWGIWDNHQEIVAYYADVHNYRIGD